ncbi:MAG: sel1 repeat family protein [Desulfovibrionaceae bacterium]|nr:sel1 repeat family protein [Desulfovibrionaceae bacterium]
MQAQLRHDPARGAGYGVINVRGFDGRDTDILFSLRRASDGTYLGSGDWLEAEQRLAPDVIQYQGDSLRLLIGPAVVDMLDALNTFAITVYSSDGEGRRYGLEIGDLVYSSLAGGQGIVQTTSAPLSMSPMPEMRFDPAPAPQLEPEPVPSPPPASEHVPEPQLPDLKDPVEHKSKTPLMLLLLVLACAAGGAYWWKFAQAPESSPPAPASQAAPAPSRDLPPLQRARELLRVGIAPEQAVELAKDMQTPEGADGAFLLLEDAAQKGSPEAMLGLARFYDPADAAPKGSILNDPVQAYDWYTKAKDKGQGAADDKLKALRAWAEAEKDRNPQAKHLLEIWK